MDFRIARRGAPLCLLLLLPPEAVFAKQTYPVTLTFEGGNPLCARRPEHRTIMVDGASVSFQNPFEPCTAPLARDGSFALACSEGGGGVSYKISGKITGPQIAGSIEATNRRRRSGTDVVCDGTFAGTRRAAAAKPAAP